MDQECIVPHDNDILLGRGGKNNQHCGNEHLRSLARSQRESYKLSSKKGKSYISRQLVAYIYQLSPPGRFLKRDSLAGEWREMGDGTAREKAAQALRDAVSTYINSPLGASSEEIQASPCFVSQEHRRSYSDPAAEMSDCSSISAHDATSISATYQVNRETEGCNVFTPPMHNFFPLSPTKHEAEGIQMAPKLSAKASNANRIPLTPIRFSANTSYVSYEFPQEKLTPIRSYAETTDEFSQENLKPIQFYTKTSFGASRKSASIGAKPYICDLGDFFIDIDGDFDLFDGDLLSNDASFDGVSNMNISFFKT